MDQINVELTLQDWNAVLQALSRMPFGDVAHLIANLRKQIEPQISNKLDKNN